MEPRKITRQNTPSEIKRENQEFRLALRKKKINEAIWAKRNPTNPIKGYDIGKYSLVADISKKDAGYVGQATT